MEYRILGKTGLKISRLGFGGIPIQKIDANGTKKLIGDLIKKGINFIDTARGYTVSEEYLGFALKLLIAFGVVFEMPLFSYFLSRFGILSPDFMRRQRRYAILFIFIVAAILTPPDVFSQCLMAMPMLLLYEVSIYVSAMAYKKKDEKKEAPEEEEMEESKEEQA